MVFFQDVLKFLDIRIEKPDIYGYFHIASLVITLLVAFALCLLWKRGVIKEARRVILVASIIALVFEIYKFIIISFGYKDGITFNFPMQEFPWQVATTAIVIGFIAGLSKGKIHKNLCAYLATYTFLVGAYVMLYPAGEFTTSLGICIQSMVSHGLMVAIAIFLLYTGHVKVEMKTILRALPIFVICVSIAVAFNEAAHLAEGLIPGADKINTFNISPYCESTLPIYSWIHQAVPYPVNVIIYAVLFTLAAFLMLLIPIGIKSLAEKDFDAEYAEEDERKAREALEAQEKAELEIVRKYEAKQAAKKAAEEKEKAELEAKKAAEEAEKAETKAEKEEEKAEVEPAPAPEEKTDKK